MKQINTNTNFPRTIRRTPTGAPAAAPAGGAAGAGAAPAPVGFGGQVMHFLGFGGGGGGKSVGGGAGAGAGAGGSRGGKLDFPGQLYFDASAEVDLAAVTKWQILVAGTDYKPEQECSISCKKFGDGIDDPVVSSE